MRDLRFSILAMIMGLVAGYFFVALFTYALFYPHKTLVITTPNPMLVAEKTVRPGDTLHYTLSYCKYIDKTSIVHRQLIDGQVIQLQDVDGVLPVGCGSLDRSVVIPETINPGRYKLSVSIDYSINPIRTAFRGAQRTSYETEYFEVEEATKPATAVINGVPTALFLNAR